MSKLIVALKNSIAQKRRNRWSREVGSGFIEEDIRDMRYTPSKIHLEFEWGSQTIPIRVLNLRETEEALKWTEHKPLPRR